MAGSPDTPETRKRQPRRRRPETERERFARAIARAELGRHYFDANAEEDLREALERKPRPKK